MKMTSSGFRALSTAILLTAFATPSFAQNTDTTDSLNASSLAQSSSGQSTMTPSKNWSMDKQKGWHHEDVDARISQLHDQLKITPDEESLWSPVAQAMRDNAAAMKSSFEDRKGKHDMTALEDMKSFQAIAAAHAEGLQKLIDASTPLYNAMPDDQKKLADHVFGHQEMAKKKHMEHMKPTQNKDNNAQQ